VLQGRRYPRRKGSSGSDGLPVWINALWGAEPTGYAELRWRTRREAGMGRSFIELRDPRLPELIRARGGETDVYAGVAPRARRDGTRAGIERAHVLWVDLDGAEALRVAERFSPAPSMILASGSEGCGHAYWALWPPAGPDEVERANRRLAHHLGADLRATDAPRILRPPGTFNWKQGWPAPVELLDVNYAIYAVPDVVGALPDPPPSRVDPSSEPASPVADDPLKALPVAQYVEALTGLAPDASGKLSCPLPDHDDRTPSFQVYPSNDSWFCFGCERGGRIYQLAALLAGYPLPLRGDDFRAVRRVLLAQLHEEAAA